jgi:hypothetical protein
MASSINPCVPKIGVRKKGEAAMDDFGKDFGLISEVVITGRKALMTREAYAFLAHNQAFFAKIAGLTRHQAILKKVRISADPVNNELAEKLIQDVGRIVGEDGCICCNIGGYSDAWILFVSYDDDASGAADNYSMALALLSRSPDTPIRSRAAQKILHECGVNAERAFCKMLTARLKELGLHPAELAEFCPVFEWDKGSKRIELCEMCYDFEDFVKVVRQIVWQRALLSQLK